MSRARNVSRLAVALMFVSEVAGAADDPNKRVCLSTYVEAQAARQDGKLRAAQASLLQCGRSECPTLIRNDCVRWLREVTEATPTVVLSATGPDGQDRSDARVSIDGALLVSRLDGRPVPVDPGEHTFRFEFADGASVEQRVLVREGEHDRAVAGVLPRNGADGAAVGARSATQRPVPLVAWALGGVGATSLLVSATFAGLAWFGSPGWISSQSCRPSCARGDVDTVQQRFAVADVAGAVGLLSLGAAAYFFLTRPERPAPPPLAIGLAPGMIGADLSGQF